MSASAGLRLSISVLLLFVCILCFVLPARLCSGQSSVTVTLATVASTLQCPSPKGVSLDPLTGTLYAACYSTGVVAVRGSNVTILANSTQCPCAWGVHFDSQSQMVYAACKGGNDHGAGKVVAINGSAVDTIASAVDCPNARAVVSNGAGTVYAACWSGIIAIEASNMYRSITVLSSTVDPPCVGGVGLFLDPVSGVLYAACYHTGVISIRGNTVSLLASYEQCPGAQGVYFSRGVLYAACDLGGIIAIRDGSIDLIATSSQCPNPTAAYVGSTTGLLYAACSSGSIGGIIALNQGAVITVATGTQCWVPWAITADAFGTLYVPCEGSGLLSIRTSAVTTLATAAQCLTPRDVVLDSSFTLYAACHDGGVVAISGTTVSTIATAAQCSSPAAVSVHVAGEIVYAACYFTGVIAISRGGTVTTIANVTQCPTAIDVDVDQSIGIVYAVCQTGVIAIDGSTVRLIANATQCPTATSVTVGPAGRVFAACFHGLIAIDGSSISTLVPRFVCSSSSILSAAYDSTRRVLLVGGCNAGGLFSISASTGALSTLVANSRCPNPTSITSHANGTYAACSDGSIIAMRSGVVSTIANANAALCLGPDGIALDPLSGNVVVTCSGGGVLFLSENLDCPPGLMLTSSGCARCSLGTFRDRSMLLSGQPACAECAPGTVASTPGAVACTVCAPSTYAASRLIGCQNCTAGSYSDSFGATRCSLCAAGSYGSCSVPCNSSACSGVCSAGYWCPSGSTSATQIACGAQSVYCPRNSSSPASVDLGMFSGAPASSLHPTTTLTAQFPCALGSYCDGSGLARNCSAGSFQNQTAQSTCIRALQGPSQQTWLPPAARVVCRANGRLLERLCVQTASRVLLELHLRPHACPVRWVATPQVLARLAAMSAKQGRLHRKPARHSAPAACRGRATRRTRAECPSVSTAPSVERRVAESPALSVRRDTPLPQTSRSPACLALLATHCAWTPRPVSRALLVATLRILLRVHATLAPLGRSRRRAEPLSALAARQGKRTARTQVDCPSVSIALQEPRLLVAPIACAAHPDRSARQAASSAPRALRARVSHSQVRPRASSALRADSQRHSTAPDVRSVRRAAMRSATAPLHAHSVLRARRVLSSDPRCRALTVSLATIRAPWVRRCALSATPVCRATDRRRLARRHLVLRAVSSTRFRALAVCALLVSRPLGALALSARPALSTATHRSQDQCACPALSLAWLV